MTEPADTTAGAAAGSKSKELVIDYGHGKSSVEISPTQTLADVRDLLLEEFDEDMFPQGGEQWAFWVNGLRITRKQEARKVAWDYINNLVGDNNNKNNTTVLSIQSIVTKQQQQQQQQPRDGTSTSTVDTDILTVLEEEDFYENAKLPKTLLEKSQLEDYIAAADAQSDSPYTKELLDYLIGLQEIDTCSDTDADELFGHADIDEPNLFVSVIASSGTGKTQLAATAALNYTENATTVYLQFGNGNSVQRFYRPHMNQSALVFKDQISKFLDKFRSGNVVTTTATATMIKAWAESSRDDGACVFVRILYRLLFDEDIPEICYLRDMKNKIKDKGRAFLVFLDEVPQKEGVHFNTVLCLRDTLRYLGIAPILMSTHTGAQDYVGGSSRSSTAKWMHIISKLPPYKPYPATQEKQKLKEKLILESERPLVLGMALRLSKNGDTVPQIVRKIRARLQQAKGLAWIDNPALQLVQLFCTDIELDKKVFTVAHSLVGHHFGCLQQMEKGTTNFGARSYTSTEAVKFASSLSVSPVSARVEPLLYLALVTWDEDMLKPDSKEDAYFPLTNGRLEPLTVREAYNSCSNYFTPKASSVNQQALKANGDLLEVLVHASLTLASMKTSVDGNTYLAGVALEEYLHLVRRLMLPGKFDCTLPPEGLFKKLNLNVESITVPALGGADSGLPIELAGATSSSIGFLSRPVDKAMVDGKIYLMCKDENEKPKRCDTPCISIECKNYTNGVTADLLKEVFKRIDSNIKFCFVFVSSFKGGIFTKTKLDQLKKDCFTKHPLNSISVVRWDLEKEPTFFRIGGKPFQATAEKTQLLVAIIEVGLVEENIWDCRKRKRGIQECANQPSDVV